MPFVWLFFVSTRSFSAWLSMAGQQGAAADPDLSGSPIDSALLTFLIALGLYVLYLRADQTIRILTRNKWILLLFLFMAASVIWSNFPAISLRRWFRSVGTLVMVLVVLTEHQPLEAMRTLLRACISDHHSGLDYCY